MSDSATFFVEQHKVTQRQIVIPRQFFWDEMKLIDYPKPGFPNCYVTLFLDIVMGGIKDKGLTFVSHSYRTDVRYPHDYSFEFGGRKVLLEKGTRVFNHEPRCPLVQANNYTNSLISEFLNLDVKTLTLDVEGLKDIKLFDSLEEFQQYKSDKSEV